MHTFIALFRGINVSGQKMIPMEKLRVIFEDLGCTGVTTYIQSGNVVFQSMPVKPFVLAEAIRDMFGFSVPVLLKTREEWRVIATGNPYVGKGGIDESFLHVTFFADVPKRDAVKEILAGEYGEDECVFRENVAYLFCPGGYGKTKLSNAFLEKKTGCIATTRNWKTVLKLLELSD